VPRARVLTNIYVIDTLKVLNMALQCHAP
jgi:hypothetical protein